MLAPNDRFGCKHFSLFALTLFSERNSPYLRTALPCAAGGGGIYAKQIDHRIKIFTTWDPDNYYLGVPGDYMAVRTDDLKDVYIIARNIFEKTYEEMKP